MRNVYGDCPYDTRKSNVPVDILVKSVVGGEGDDGPIPDGEAEETLSDGCVPHL